MRPATAVQTGDPSATYQVTFDASGDGSFGSSNVITVDGTGYTASQLPVTLTWFAGTQHSYAFQTLAEGTGTQVGISSVSGLETAASGKITATSTGTVRTTYTTQYLLTVNGGSGLVYGGSPVGGLGSCNGTSSCWYNSGTTVQVTTNNVWSVVAGQSRQNLASWNVDGGSNTNAVRSGSGTWTTNPITMTSPQTLNLNSVTQYSVTLQNSVPASGTLPEILTSYSYTGPVTNPQAANNPNFQGSLSPWTPTQSCSGTCLTYSASYSTSGAYLQAGCFISYSSGQYYCSDYGEVSQNLISPPGGVTYTSSTVSVGVSVANYYASTAGDGNVCAWISGGSTSCTTSSGTLTATWSGSTTTIPTVNIESTAFALTNSQYTTSYGEMQAYVTNVVWSVTYTTQISGSTTSTTQAADVVSGNSVTYAYTVGYTFPSGSSATSWSAALPAGETYFSNNCSGATVSGSTMTDISSASCAMTATGNGTYASTATSPTGDSWFDSGSVVSVAASASGKFTFSQWTSSSALTIASSTSASTTVQVNTFGTITAGFSVNE